MSKKLDKALMSPIGGLPADNEKEFIEVVAALIEAWGITRPQEVMMVNRMVSTWMKLKRTEELLGKYDLFFEQRDKSGTIIGIRMNDIANYLSKLDADFRGYYKALQSKIKIEKGEEVKDLLDLINAKTIKKV